MIPSFAIAGWLSSVTSQRASSQNGLLKVIFDKKVLQDEDDQDADGRFTSLGGGTHCLFVHTASFSSLFHSWGEWGGHFNSAVPFCPFTPPA